MTVQTSVTLETPLKEGDKEITSVFVRKPMPGELRGLKLPDLVQGDVDTYIKLLPRITSPVITEAEITTGKLDTADFTSLVNEVIGFLLPRSLRDALPSV